MKSARVLSALLLVFAVLCVSLKAGAVSFSAYEDVPVILHGSDIPAFKGVKLKEIVGFRYENGSWKRIPLQADRIIDANTCIESEAVPGASIPDPCDQDPSDKSCCKCSVPKDSPESCTYKFCREKRVDFSGNALEQALDDDDEIVFLAKEGGTSRAPSGSRPEPDKLSSNFYEITLTNPTNTSEKRYVYIFYGTSGMQYEDYGLNITTSAGYKINPSKYPYDGCDPPEDYARYTDIRTPYFCAHFATRWSLDDIVIRTDRPSHQCTNMGDPDTEDPYDLLDRWRGNEGAPGGKTDDTAWGCRSRLINPAEESVTTSSPYSSHPVVRYVRGVLGAKSAINTTLYTYVYPAYISVDTRLRVHEMKHGMTRVFDWNDNARGITVKHYDSCGSGHSGSDVINGDLSGSTIPTEVSCMTGEGDTWEMIEKSGVGKIFTYARPVDDPNNFSKRFNFVYHDSNDPWGDGFLYQENSSALGNYGIFFDLFTPEPSKSCLGKIPDPNNPNDPSQSIDPGSYYQPFRARHVIRVLPSTSPLKAADLIEVERNPLIVSSSYNSSGSSECTDGQTRDCPLQQGVCSGAKQTCSGGVWQPCDYGSDYEQTETKCDNLDNDCDGSTDEDIFRNCPLQQGVCSGAKQTCSGGVWQSCDYGPFYDGSNEKTCSDGRDNDCDSFADSSDDDCRQSCEDKDSDGYRTGLDCPAGEKLDCNDRDGSVHPGAKERCDNNIDDNCNGSVNEGFENMGASCEVGVGACKRTGKMVCASDGVSLVCDAEPGSPSPEICGNGIDEDCDGKDEPCNSPTPSTDKGVSQSKNAPEPPQVSGGGCSAGSSGRGFLAVMVVFVSLLFRRKFAA